jgi:hypothetical protein
MSKTKVMQDENATVIANTNATGNLTPPFVIWGGIQQVF